MNPSEKPYVIGLDLGGTNSVFGIVDANAHVVAETSVKTRGHNDDAQQYVRLSGRTSQDYRRSRRNSKNQCHGHRSP